VSADTHSCIVAEYIFLNAQVTHAGLGTDILARRCKLISIHFYWLLIPCWYLWSVVVWLMRVFSATCEVTTDTRSVAACLLALHAVQLLQTYGDWLLVATWSFMLPDWWWFVVAARGWLFVPHVVYLMISTLTILAVWYSQLWRESFTCWFAGFIQGSDVAIFYFWITSLLQWLRCYRLF
jgi:hypothetical protein